MRNKKRIIITSFVCIIVLLGTILANAKEGSFLKVSDEKLKVLGYSNSQAMLYNSLQQSELSALNQNDTVYNEDGVIIGSIQTINEGNSNKLNKIKSNFKVNQLKSDGVLQNIETNDIPISFESLDGKKVDSIKVANINGNKRIIPNNPDLCSYNLLTSDDGSYGVIWTEKGMWKITADGTGTDKISENSYNGLSYDDIILQYNNNYGDNGETIYWNNDPKINKDGNYIVYTSNRNNVGTNGNSIWIYKNNDKKEKNIIAGEGGVNYSIVGWCDKDVFIYAKYQNDKGQYYISNSFGESKELKLEGDNPDIMQVGPGIIAYIPEQSLQNEIIIATVDSTDASSKVIAKQQIDGTIRLPSAGFSPNCQKYAFLYAPNDNVTIQKACVLYINTNILKSIEARNLSDKKVIKSISGIEWNNTSELLVLAGDSENQSTWTYREEE